MNARGVWKAVVGAYTLPSNRWGRWRMADPVPWIAGKIRGLHQLTRVMLVSAISCGRRYMRLGNMSLTGAK
jgi:hypothetical protein